MRSRDERGLAVAVETALVLPVVLSFVGLVISLGTHALEVQALGAATSQAARTGSLERTESGALQAARDAVAVEVAAADLECDGLTSDVSITAEAGVRSVKVSVACQMPVGVPGLMLTRSVHVIRTSTIDVMRSQ